MLSDDGLIDEARRELAGFEGRLVGPSDADYDEQRAVWNAAASRRPALIARCASTADVVAAVTFARRSGRPLSVRSAGHDVGGRGVCDHGIVIDLRDCCQVEVDAERSLVDVGGGATWGQVNDATHAHGLATTSAALSATGVAGVTLGGGFGWMLSTHGYCVDNLVGAEVVLASGAVVWTDESHEPELLWALRGAGANLGAVTRLRFACHPLASAFAGALAVPLDDADRLFEWYLQITPDLPDGTMAYVILGPSPAGGHLALVQLFDSGDAGLGAELAEEVRGLGVPIVLDQCGILPYPAINRLLDAAYPPGRRSRWRSSYLTGLDAEQSARLVAAYRRSPSPDNRVLIQHVHGAGCRVAADATSFVHREEGYNLLASGDWSDAADDAANLAWLDDVLAALADVRRPAVYVNYLDIDEDHRVPEAYGAVYERLRRAKAAYDPDNAFRSNPNIAPA